MDAAPDWTLYRSFAALLAEGSLSGAARTLGLTQPTVARHLDQLEAALGCRLFLRSPRGLSPTDAARAMAPAAAAMVAAAAALRRAAADEAGTVAGTVRISASEVFAAERLPPILAALRARHPGLAVEVVASNASEDLLRRDADIAVRMFDPVQSALVARRLGDVELGLHAAEDYLARRGVPASLADLPAFDLIGFDTPTPALRAFADRYPEIVRAGFALAADSDLVQLAAIRAGFGIGVAQVGLPGSAGLRRLLPDAFAPTLPVWLVMHEDLRSSPRCAAAWEAVAGGLAAQIARR